MKCPLCEAGNVIIEVQDFTQLENHFLTHEKHSLAFALADLLEIIDAKNRKEEK